MTCAARRIGLTLRVDDARERRDALDQAWYGVCAQAGVVPVPLPNLPAPIDGESLVQAARLDGLILTGGNDLSHLPGAESAAPERDALERALLDACSRRRLPVLGVCRGMQHLVHYHGGHLRRAQDHVARPHPVSRAGEDSFLPEDRDLVNSFHGWCVVPEDLPDALRPAALAPDGTVEAVDHLGLPQRGIMWHPERDPHDARDVALLIACFRPEGADR